MKRGGPVSQDGNRTAPQRMSRADCRRAGNGGTRRGRMPTDAGGGHAFRPANERGGGRPGMAGRAFRGPDAPPEQRRDKGGFGGKKTFHPKDQTRRAAYSRPPLVLVGRHDAGRNPAGCHYTAGAKRPPLVLVCKPLDSLQAGSPINRRSPPGLCRPQVLPNGLGMMAMR